MLAARKWVPWVESIKPVEGEEVPKHVKIVYKIKHLKSAGSLKPKKQLEEPTETLCAESKCGKRTDNEMSSHSLWRECSDCSSRFGLTSDHIVGSDVHNEMVNGEWKSLY